MSLPRPGGPGGEPRWRVEGRQQAAEYERVMGRKHENRFPDDWQWEYRGGPKALERLKAMLEVEAAKQTREAVEASKQLRQIALD